MKYVIATLIAVVLLATPAAAAPPTGPCRGLSVKGTIRCAVELWPVSGGYAEALRIAERESNLIPGATSSSGTYRGIFQIGAYHITDVPSWPDNVMAGPWFDRWFPFLHSRDPNMLYKHRFNTMLAIRVAHLGGWGPWAL